MEPKNSYPKISCIVCTYNREDFIIHCLEALTHQSLSSNLYEVIVVDNNSKDTTAELAKDFIHARPGINFSYVFEEKQGSPMLGIQERRWREATS